MTQASRRPIHPHTSGQAARQMSLWQWIPFFFPQLSVPALSCFCSHSAPVWPDFQAEWRAFFSGPWTQGWYPYPALTLKALKTPSLVWPAPTLCWPTPWAGRAMSGFFARVRQGEEGGWGERGYREEKDKGNIFPHTSLPFWKWFPFGRKDEKAEHMLPRAPDCNIIHLDYRVWISQP